MYLKVFILVCAASACQTAGLLAPAYGGWNPYSNYPAQPAIATQQSNTLRSPFNLGQISTFSKAIDTPFSSVRKSDVRVSNPGVAIGGFPGVAIGGFHGLAPAYHGLGAPLAPAFHGIGAPLAPAYHGVAAPLVSHVGVSPYAKPVAKVATTGELLGVAYSAAPAVSHMTYTNGLGLTYAW